eukprot:GSChrysophyteH1.ASY1.ANO1.2465.1 assembled CDS
MPIKFVLMVNKQGQTRLASYFSWYPIYERVALETEIIRRCLMRTDENELAILEFIHSLVETMDKYFESVCELDIMYHIEKAHYIVNEMVANGVVVENNKHNILRPLVIMDKVQENEDSFLSKLR